MACLHAFSSPSCTAARPARQRATSTACSATTRPVAHGARTARQGRQKDLNRGHGLRAATRLLVRVAAASSAPAEVVDAVRGCRTVLAELQGLDFPRGEVRLYMAAARKVPKGFRGTLTDVERARVALDLLLKVDEDGDPLPASRFTDPEGLALTQALLGELWRWRRRGGGMSGDEEMRRPHETALAEIQDFKPEDMNAITSSLLDNLPNISDADKQEMSRGMQEVAVGAFQGAVWGSMVLCIAFLIIFNFLRMA